MYEHLKMPYGWYDEKIRKTMVQLNCAARRCLRKQVFKLNYLENWFSEVLLL